MTKEQEGRKERKKGECLTKLPVQERTAVVSESHYWGHFCHGLTSLSTQTFGVENKLILTSKKRLNKEWLVCREIS